jgi:hypothetical protein
MSKTDKEPQKKSERYWYDYYNGKYDNDIHLEETFDKELYDKLVSLEARIEELKELSDMHHAYCLKHDLVEHAAIKVIGAKLIKYESELAELVKEHNL